MCELLFQKIKGSTSITIEVPDGVFAGKPCKKDNNVGVAVNETRIEVTKTQKGLNILNFTRFWPIQNDLNLPSVPIIKPRYSILVLWNSHFGAEV